MAAASEAPDPNGADTGNGALAQLGERLHGMQEVSGSIPLGSTKFPCHPKCLAIGRSLSFSTLSTKNWRINMPIRVLVIKHLVVE
jgi:hypothetical protein